jgi:hypothetical protein
VSDNVTGRVPQTSVEPDHGHHDALLVARFAAGDAEVDELGAARALVEQCSQCAALADDLRLVASGMHKLPQPVRPRDFQLTQSQAEQLRGGFAQRLLRALAAPRWALVRPVAGAAMTIGIVLAVFGSTLSAYAPGAASAPAFDQGSQPAAMSEEGSAAPSVAPVPSAVPAPTTEPGGPQPVSGETSGPAGPASVPPPPSPGGLPENYTDKGSGPPSAGGSSGGETGFVPVSQAPEPTSQVPQPAASSTNQTAPGTPATQTNPIPASEAGGPPSQSTLVRQALILGGLAVAVLGLALLLLVSYARRKVRVETGKSARNVRPRAS